MVKTYLHFVVFHTNEIRNYQHHRLSLITPSPPSLHLPWSSLGPASGGAGRAAAAAGAAAAGAGDDTDEGVRSCADRGTASCHPPDGAQPSGLRWA